MFENREIVTRHFSVGTEAKGKEIQISVWPLELKLFPISFNWEKKLCSVARYMEIDSPKASKVKIATKIVKIKQLEFRAFGD